MPINNYCSELGYLFLDCSNKNILICSYINNIFCPCLDQLRPFGSDQFTRSKRWYIGFGGNGSAKCRFPNAMNTRNKNDWHSLTPTVCGIRTRFIFEVAQKGTYWSSYISPLPSLFPPGISSGMTLRMDAGAKTRTYKIGQAAKLLDVKPFVLRFWEGEFKDVLVPVRTPAGQRAYTESNVSTVREIKRLLYEEGLTIEGAKKRLGQPHQGKAPHAAPQHPVGASALPLLGGAPGSATAGGSPGVSAGATGASTGVSGGVSVGSPADSYVGSASSAPAGVSAEALAAAESAAAEAQAQAEAARAATRGETARADAASAEAQRAAHRSTALATTLEDVARELKAIRDLLT